MFAISAVVLLVALGVSLAFLSNTSVVLPARLEGGIASVATTEAGVLYIRISGFPSSAGGVKIALYNSREAYVHRRGSLRKAYLPITNGAFTAATGRTFERIQSSSATATVRRYIRAVTSGTFSSAVFAVSITKNDALRAI